LDRVYRALLATQELRLLRHHREHLFARGLGAEDLDRDGYRSLPPGCRAAIVRRLRERFEDALLLATPGIIVKDGSHGRYATLAGQPGILIPVHAATNKIVGLVVRPDVPGDGGKYRWLSSAHGCGPSPGARVHVPSAVKPSPSVRLVEGTLKANVARALSGEPVIGLPGAHITNEAIGTLRELGAGEALLALDTDTRTNQHIARAQIEGLARLKATGFDYGIVRWDPGLGKGYDDMLLALRRGAV
jgi:hypothetical protein